MSCRRVHEIDLPGFLATPRDAEFADFRGHYPACPECAAEVRAWTELEIALRGPAEHPAPELLLRYEDEPMALAAERRGGLDRHLAGCPSCRDELRALRAFEPAAAAAAPAAAAPAAGGLLASLRRWLWQPALGYALALLLLVPLVADRWSSLEEAAYERTPASAPAALPAEPSLAADPKRERVLLEAEEAEAPRATAERVAPSPAGDEQGVGRALDTPRAPQPQRKEELRDEVQVVAKQRADATGGRLDADLQLEERAEAEAEAEAEAALRQQARAPAETDLLMRRETAPAPSPARARVARNQAAPGAGLGSFAGAARLLAAREGDAFVLEIPPPALSGDAREIEVRVIHADGRRRLVELVEVPASGPARVRVPASWLTPGPHRVEVRVPGDPPGAARLFEYALVVGP